MEENELFLFKRSLLSLRTQCNNLFIPPTGERPLLEKRREREKGSERDGWQREKTECGFNMQQNVSGWVINSLQLKAPALFSFLSVHLPWLGNDHFGCVWVGVCPDDWLFPSMTYS